MSRPEKKFPLTPIDCWIWPLVVMGIAICLTLIIMTVQVITDNTPTQTPYYYTPYTFSTTLNPTYTTATALSSQNIAASATLARQTQQANFTATAAATETARWSQFLIVTATPTP